MGALWYYVENGERKGPIGESELSGLIKDKKINENDYIWRKGFENWKKVKDAEELTAWLIDSPVIPQTTFDIGEKTQDIEIKPTFDWASVDLNEESFYVKVGPDRGEEENQYGPYSLNLIKKLYDEKRINEKSYIWANGMDTWLLIGSIPIFEQIFLKVAPTIEEKNRRENIRRPFVAKLLFHDNKQVYEGVCRDISIGGMQVLLKGFPGKVGDKISLNVHPDNREFSFVANGKIVRVLEGNMGFSFRFIDLSQESLEIINKYVSS